MRSSKLGVQVPDVPPLGTVLEFMRLMWAVDHALQQASKRMHATIGVTGPQRLVLRIVGRFPGLSSSDLAVLLHVHPSTLTGVLRRLEQQGLVRRRRDPRDGRRWHVGLTARGRLVNARMEGTVENAVRRVLQDTHSSNVDAARTVLRALAEGLEAS